MRAVLYLAAKDLRQRLRDRSAILIAVVVPFALAFILNLVFGGAATPRPFPYAVVDADGGPVAASFTGVLDQLAGRELITVRRVATVAEAERLAEDGAVSAAFVVPEGFSAAAAAGTGAPPIEVIGNVDSPTAAELARSLAGSFVAHVNSVRTAAIAATGEAATPEAIGAAAVRADALDPPVTLADVSAARKILDVKTYFAASMAVFFLFFTVQFGVSSLIEERESGTLNRLLAMPIRPGSVLAGKLLTSLVLGVFSLAVLAVASSLLMGASWGDPAGVAALIGAGVLAATGVTAVVASLARTAEQAGSWQAVISMLLGMVGGVFFPVAQAPGLKLVALATPHAWFLRGLGELAAGGGLRQVLPAVGAMLAFAAVAGGFAVLRLRKVVRA